MPAQKMKARFFEPMLLLATSSLPEDEEWEYELKLDNFRAIGFKSNGKVHLRSRNNKDFAARYPAIAKALEKLPDQTVRSMVRSSRSTNPAGRRSTRCRTSDHRLRRSSTTHLMC
jgi:hypothetical protein